MKWNGRPLGRRLRYTGKTRREGSVGKIYMNVQDHELVPKHEVLTPQERKEVLETLGVDKDQLPQIKETDPMSKAIGAKKGDVLRIIRKSPTAGQSVYYRTVIKG